ncbi:MAG: DUF4143 domain-containing protein, partial [Bifidobacteriaceae bacterium]|nr:DUF4143 domain-containing protein [Bifidobacteriaceae bacterium]
EAFALPAPDRSAWYDGYLYNLLSRDVETLADVRNPGAFQRLFRAVAANTAGLPAIDTLGRAAGLGHRTTKAYLDVLEETRLLDRVEPFFENTLKRMIKTPKYYLTDSGLAAYLGGLSRRAVTSDGDRLGRLIETFVASQLRPLLDLASPRARLCHLRDTEGRREIDLLLEAQDGTLVGIEIKSAAVIAAGAARHLVWLRNTFPDRFAAGIVLYTGPAIFRLDSKIWAVPISTLWTPPATGRK